MRLLLCAFILAASSYLVSAGYMDTAYEWKYIDYLWPSEAKRQEAIKNGAYNISNVMPMDVDKYKDGRVFISLLGMVGVPAGLATVTEQYGPSGPLVKPYPDWSWFKKGDCDSITNVYRIAIDECDRLWVLDTGYLDGGEMNCPPQLLSFDLKTNRMLNRIKIPKEVAGNKEGQSLLATPIVETEGRFCKKTTVFMADAYGEGLIVLNNTRLFRLENEVYRHKEDAKIITVGNDSVDLQGGIVGMSISPKLFPEESRLLYFRPLSSFDIYAAETQVIEGSANGDDIKYLEAKNVLSSQAVGQAFSSEGTLFLGMTRETAIACWNRYRELTKENIEIVVQDNVRIDYPNGLKVIPPSHASMEEELWVLSNRLANLNYGELDANIVNFRVLKAPVKRLITGTKCEMPKKTKDAYDKIKNEEEDQLIFPN